MFKVRGKALGLGMELRVGLRLRGKGGQPSSQSTRQYWKGGSAPRREG